MAQVSNVLRSFQGGYSFWCPGCRRAHGVGVRPPASVIWQFDGNLDAPTFSPSIFVKTGHHAEGKTAAECWACQENARSKAAGQEERAYHCGLCHSFVKAGQIQFLSDCTHALAGQTVPLPPLPDWLRD